MGKMWIIRPHLQHSDTGFGDKIVAAVRHGIKTDARLRCNTIIAVDDGTLKPRAAPDNRVIHDNAIFDLRVFFDYHFTMYDGVAQASPLINTLSPIMQPWISLSTMRVTFP